MTSAAPTLDADELPLRGLTVIELSHMIMGPSAGLILADLGARVIKIEPLEGDNTRRLKGSGIGYFPVFNRNKESLAVDLKSADGQALVRDLAARADFLLENFRDDGLKPYGLDYASLSPSNPRLIYVSLKGFLSGPYQARTALDEVVQMMGGMAYINGDGTTPRRVAPSANDILGGTFGVVGALAALNDRHRTGRGRHVRAGLFETDLLLVAQFIAQYQLSGTPAIPVGKTRKPPWGVYDIFETADGRVFVAVVSDQQWRVFARDFLPPPFADDERLRTSVQREAARDWVVPAVAAALKPWKTAELCAALEAKGLSFGQIREPHQLLEDPHLRAGGALVDATLPGGERFSGAALPVEFDGRKPGKRWDPPPAGAHTRAVLASLGVAPDRIESLLATGVVAAPADGAPADTA